MYLKQKDSKLWYRVKSSVCLVPYIYAQPTENIIPVFPGYSVLFSKQKHGFNWTQKTVEKVYK